MGCPDGTARFFSLGYFVSPLRYISVSLLTAMYRAENLQNRRRF